MDMRAEREPLEPQLPRNFAGRVAALALHPDGYGFEDWIVVVLLFAMGRGGLFFVGPVLANVARAMVIFPMPLLPWRQAMMAAICIGVAWAIERGWMRLHQDARQL